ncbi:unnamed protein product [Moneuplotes crassus]|uniref:Uncharacterized protein n=1 Tax=Euplotes crassus TaxID=5936 RepID=A0AAD1XLW3_EUPCR|nr:unnamed protein product [Moneuplotes crassus]
MIPQKPQLIVNYIDKKLNYSTSQRNIRRTVFQELLRLLFITPTPKEEILLEKSAISTKDDISPRK